MIIVREILTHTSITWLQFIFSNTLLYPFSVIKFPRPELIVYWIVMKNKSSELTRLD